MEDERILDIEVISDAMIEKIEIYKNGSLVNVYENEDRANDKYNLELYSSSEPFSPVSSRPRNQREWLGELK